MADLSIFKLDSQTITIKDTTARQAAESAKTLATTASGNATTALNKINELESEKADTIISSTSGAIASFPDGAARPVDDLTVQIEPVQDLHGYDAPWPAGGGVNLVDTDELIPATGASYNKYGWKNVLKNNTTYTYSVYGETGYAFRLMAGHTKEAVPQPNIGLSKDYLAPGRYQTFTTPSDIEDWEYLFLGGSVSGSANANCQFQIELGENSNPTYRPYSNICPISGWTGCEIDRVGVNFGYLTENNVVSHQRDSVVYTSNGVTVTSTDSFGRTGFSMKVIPGQQYTLSFKCKKTGSAYAIQFNHKNEFSYNYWVVIPTDTLTEYSRTITTTTDVFFVGIYPNAQGSSITVEDFQFELGSTASSYEHHQGETYPITFPTEAGTVYGGTLDVTNGTLTVDRAQIASYAGETLPSTWISDRDVYSAGATPTTGAQVVYELATPITYHLTPQEITTLLGQNNIWADAGDTSVTYKADTKLYIDNKFTELQALILENLERRNRS